MPTYQYACTACSHQLEAVQSFTDDPLTDCPECQGRLRKVFNSVGIVFKGSGFYRTDSRAASNAANGKSESGEKASGKAESTTGTGGDKSADGGAAKSGGETKPGGEAKPKAPAAAGSGS